ncbi:Dabb family protein [Rubellicoccus peritrichatus]|uniref:Dabb family protein n=1 Tax=Rubellicoccus peritrichatus TaxID=3080537 RepID=A0AAQ3L8Y2_9BACT|nr:Dabb family protein [Puniceicoccus sp. CR14]WOO41525.1 Dabb family protein [Puniceicoccus sp. CR14]
MITHSVYFWTDKPGDEAGDKIIEGAKALLAPIPGVSNFRVGPSMSSSRAVVDDSFGAAICMDFENREALQAYLEHPTHIQFVTECVKPFSGRYVVYDIES